MNETIVTVHSEPVVTVPARLAALWEAKPGEIPEAMLDAATFAVGQEAQRDDENHWTDIWYRSIAQSALKAAGVAELVAELKGMRRETRDLRAERDRLKSQLYNPGTICEICFTSALEPCEPSEKWPRGLACLTCEQRERIAELEAALRKIVRSQDVVMPIELDEEITELLKPTGAGGE